MDRSPLYRDLARVEKARYLADVLEEAGCAAEDLSSLPPLAWRLAALIAGERRGRPMSPPSDATQSLVHERLIERSRPLDDRLLEGLPTA